MIDLIGRDDVVRLAETTGSECISIYLPTQHAGAETLQNPIRLKGLLARTTAELEALGLSAHDIHTRLQPATSLLDDTAFWTNVGHGLAVFIDDHDMWTKHLPITVAELAVVSDRFHLGPLIRALGDGDPFFVLAISRNEVRLLRGTRFAIDEHPLGQIPSSMAEALQFDDREPQLQSHAGERTGTGSPVAMFHGQGAGKDARQADLERFLDAIDAGVRDIVGDTGTPLVLAGVDEVVAEYRKRSRYRHIVAGSIKGNPQRTQANEFHDRAWPLVEPALGAARSAACEAIEQRSVPTLDSISAVIVAAHDGRVGSLFMPIGVQCWGRFDAASRSIEPHDTREPGDHDLFDVAAIATLSHGGDVFVVPEPDVPGGATITAALRF
jgi:hypothetical protein